MKNLDLFNLTGLVNALNENVKDGNFRFLDEIVKESKRNPSINSIDGTEREIIGKCKVANHGKKAGYLFFEKGKVPDKSDSITYEQIKLCLYPLELKNGKKIPKSTIRIYVEDIYNVLVERRDHIKSWGFGEKQICLQFSQLIVFFMKVLIEGF